MSSIQVDKYNIDGYVLMENLLSVDEVRILRAEVEYESKITDE